MTAGVTERRFAGRTDRLRRASTPGYVGGLVLLACGVGLSLSAAVSFLDDPGVPFVDTRRAATVLALASIASLASGGALRWRYTVPATLRIASVHSAVLLGWALLIGVSTVTYLACGTFHRLDEAIFESTAGFTTTALSVLSPIEGTPKGVLFWRAYTQWLGGYAGVVVITAVLPLLGVGVEQEGASTSDRRRLPLRSPRLTATTQRLGLGYLLLSIAGLVLFALAGMGPFDAVTYAMTTISTGGFANHDGSLGHFDSPLVEWVAIGGMALGGTSLVLLLAAARRRFLPARRSTELRWYVAAMTVGSAVVLWQIAPEQGLDHDSIREAVFATVSAASTTGHRVGSWSTWDGGPQVLLLLIAGVGCMSGAAGGGFRVGRALTLLSLVRREVVRQLHPRSVQVVKVGSTPVPDGVVAHMVGYQVAWLFLGLGGAVALGLSGIDLPGAISGTISALATYGPGLGDLLGGAAGVPLPALPVLTTLMLAGRLEVSPLVIGLGNLARAPGWRLLAWWRR